MRTSRLVHVGVAASIATAAVVATGLVQMVGAADTGTASVFVPITPCRLLDTRVGAENVGNRSTPLATDEAALFQVTGTNGNCTIPATATGIATNATAVNPTASSYVTFYPADANPRPKASNLNVVAGAAPTPNQVTVGLSAAGAIGIYNLGGTVDIVVDIVGYYQAAPAAGVTAVLTNDERYYTKAQVDANLAAGLSVKAAKPASRLVVDPGQFVKVSAVDTTDYSSGDVIIDAGTAAGVRSSGSNAAAATAAVELPHGATVTRLTVYVKNLSTPTGTISASLIRHPFGANAPVSMATVSAAVPDHATDAPFTTAIATALVDRGTYSYSVLLRFPIGALLRVQNVVIDYTVP